MSEQNSNALSSPVNEDATRKAHAIAKKYAGLIVSTSIPIPAPVPIISINGGSIGTEGNVSVFSGPSKGGKTALIAAIIAAALIKLGQFCDVISGIEVSPNAKGFAVLHFDSEQAKHHHYKFIKNILKRLGLADQPDNFLSYNLRQLDLKHYQNVCRELFYSAYTLYGGIHLAVIDGVADFISSVNDEKEANAIVHFFEKLAIEFKTHIILVIHLNPNSEKQRGHLGSQLQRKAESVLAVKRDGNISYLEPQFLRGAGLADVPSVQFQFDKEKGYHVGCGTFSKVDQEQQIKEQLNKLADQIFSDSPIQHVQAVKSLMELTGLSERTVKTKIKEMLTRGLVSKTDHGLYIKRGIEGGSETLFELD